MILVRNLLLLLSGNKFIQKVFLIAFLFSVQFTFGCTVIKKLSKKESDETTVPSEVVIENPVKEKTEPIREPEVKRKSVISFLLPFNADKINLNGSLTTNSYGSSSNLAIEYYNGALLALDSLKEQGYQYEVNVFDSKNDSAEIKKITTNPALLNSDIIFGPVYPNEFSGIAKFSKENKIATVSPISPTSLDKFKNPYFFMANGSLELHAERMASFVKENLKVSKVIIVRTNQSLETRYVDAFKQRLDSLDKTIQKAELNVSSGGTSSIKSELDATKENVILVSSYNQNFIITLLKYLNTLGRNYRITVLGHPKWIEFNDVDFDMIQRLNTHITTSFNPNYENPETIAFIKKYRNTYQAEPSEFAFRGFDQVYYFGKLLAKEGKVFYRKMPNEKLNSTSFVFKKDIGNNGYYNQYISVVKFENFELVEQ